MIKMRGNAKHTLHKCAIFTLLLLFCLSMIKVKCRAEESEGSYEINEEIDGIVENFRKIIPEGGGEINDIDDTAESVGIKRLLEGIFTAVSGQMSETCAFLLLLLGVALISSLSSVYNGEMSLFSSRAISVVVSALLFERLIFLLRGTLASLSDMNEFFSAVIPISLSVNSIGASPTTATTQAVGMGITLGVYSFISQRLVLPIVSTVFVSSAATGIDLMFGRIAKGVKDVFVWVMGIFTTLVGATFSIQSVISASADSATLRSARYAISGTIPIVGNAVSGALGLVAGGAYYARGLVGGGAVGVVLTLVISPLITLILYRLCIKLGLFFFSVTSLEVGTGALSSFLFAIDALIASYALTSAVYLVELLAFLKGGASFA